MIITLDTDILIEQIQLVQNNNDRYYVEIKPEVAGDNAFIYLIRTEYLGTGNQTAAFEAKEALKLAEIETARLAAIATETIRRAAFDAIYNPPIVITVG